MRLNLKPGPAEYVLIPATDESEAVTISALPALTEVFEEAKGDDAMFAYANEQRDALGGGDEGEERPLTAADIRMRGRFGVMMAKAVARQVIVGWSGVEDEDGKPAPVTPDRIEAFIDLPPIYEAFAEVYLGRWLTLQAEKKGSAPSPDGTSAGVRNTARRARPAPKNARAK